MKVIINHQVSWLVLLPAPLISRDHCRDTVAHADWWRSSSLACLRTSSAQARAGSPTGSGLQGCLPGGEKDHFKQLNFSLQLTDSFPEMLQEREGIGSKICKGTGLASLNSAAELVHKVAGSQSFFSLSLPTLFFFFSPCSLPQYKYPGAVSFLFGMNVMIFRGCDWLRGLSSGTHLLAWGHRLPHL